MASTQRPTRRRSARHAFDEEEAPAAAVKRPKTEVNGTGRTSGRATGATKKAATEKYTENDDEFQFTRKTRKTRSKPHVPESVEEEPAKPAPARRKKATTPAPEPSQDEVQAKRRRSARLSGDKEQITKEPSKAPPKRGKKAAPAEPKQPTDQDDKLEMVGGVTATPKPRNELHVEKKRNGETTKIIALPFADTPVIRRNKEMRKGSGSSHRRSSTGMRGRRASSLIDSGNSNALPHGEVEVKDFYTLIEQSLPEPRRMRQLLTWCGERALPNKPSGDVQDVSAIMAARAIQEELLKEFANNSDLSDWFSREDTAPVAVVKKPNPQNVKNAAMLEEMEKEVKRLEEEKAAWEALLSSSNSSAQPKSADKHTNPASTTLSQIDATLLDPSQAEILTTLQQPPTAQFTYTTPESLSTHLNTLSASLEPTIDLFADGVHKIAQYRQTAERVADRVLGNASQRLEERDKEAKEKAGTEGVGIREVLRGLSGVLSEEGR